MRDKKVRGAVDEALAGGVLWPEPWLSLSPKFAPGGTVDSLVDRHVLSPECKRIFRLGKDADPSGEGSTRAPGRLPGRLGQGEEVQRSSL